MGRRCYEVLSGLALEGFTPGRQDGCPSICDLREGLAPTPIRLRMLCASGQRKLVALTPMVVAGVLEDGPLLAHLFHDSTDEKESEAVAGSLQDTLRENGSPTLLEGPGVAAPTENARALTPRELEVLHLVSLGWRAPQIADELGLSYHTVRNHIRHCRRKLGAATKLDACSQPYAGGFCPVADFSQSAGQAWRHSLGTMPWGWDCPISCT